LIVLGYIASGPVARQNIVVARACGKGYSPHGGQERVQRKGRGAGVTFKDTPPVTYFLQ
jgi:hypothetical protein